MISMFALENARWEKEGGRPGAIALGLTLLLVVHFTTGLEYLPREASSMHERLLEDYEGPVRFWSFSPYEHPTLGAERRGLRSVKFYHADRWTKPEVFRCYWLHEAHHSLNGWTVHTHEEVMRECRQR